MSLFISLNLSITISILYRMSACSATTLRLQQEALLSASVHGKVLVRRLHDDMDCRWLYFLYSIRYYIIVLSYPARSPICRRIAIFLLLAVVC